jgi:hypothetical protein
MSSNPDEIYREKAAVEPVAPATLWLYPQLKLVEGSMQRSLLEAAKRKTSISWLYKLLMLSLLLIVSLKIWAHETARPGLLRSAEYALSLVLLAFLAVLIAQVMRTRKLLRFEISSDHSGGVDA